MKKLKTVDADTLLYQPLDKPSFVVDGLICLVLGLAIYLPKSVRALDSDKPTIVRDSGAAQNAETAE